MDTTKDLDPAAATRQRPSERGGPRTRTTGDTTAEDVNSLLQRVSGSSIEEIERVISELQAMRDALRTEGDRVQRVVADHAGTSQTTVASMRIVADGLRQLKKPVPPSD